MEYELTNAGQALAETDRNSKLDAACKTLLADKQILARILKECAVEYKDCTIEEIIDCIEQPSVGSSPLNDLVCVQLPNQQGKVALVMNIEAQQELHSRCELVLKGICHAGVISERKNTQPAGADYRSIEKVYSVWICTHPAKSWRNTITVYHPHEENLIGDAHMEPDLQVIVIGLGNQNLSAETPLLGLLEVLLHSEIPATEKMQELQKYGVQLKEDVVRPSVAPQ